MDRLIPRNFPQPSFRLRRPEEIRTRPLTTGVEQYRMPPKPAGFWELGERMRRDRNMTVGIAPLHAANGAGREGELLRAFGRQSAMPREGSISRVWGFVSRIFRREEAPRPPWPEYRPQNARDLLLFKAQQFGREGKYLRAGAFRTSARTLEIWSNFNRWRNKQPAYAFGRI